MCAHGAGISTQSSALQVVHVGHQRGLVRERRLRVQHALRRAARARGEQHRRELLASVHGSSTGRPVGQRVEIVDDELRARRRAEQRSTSLRPELMVQRRRDRAEAPARAVQHRDLVAVRRLPRDRVAGLDAARAQPAGDARDPVGELGGRAPR